MRLVYNTYAGRFSDSPRAIYNALRADAEHLWLADPAYQDGFPGGVETVEIGAPESIEALESADVVIANTHTELEWTKPPHTLYLQTWHGTPLKRVHRDVLFAPEGTHERLQRDVDRWDLLVSPNRESTRRLRRAFRFDGEVLETGYPRNDGLFAPERDEIRARVRAELEIPDGTQAILYAPTWRDDFVFAHPSGPLALAFDVASVADALAPGRCLLLRSHYLLTGRLAAVTHPAVRDVSRYAEISELYLAADVLVTDYSSVMFDFSLTGKPMLFYTYDLDAYRDSVRGLYFDLEPIAPGPLLHTAPELVAALRDVDAVAARYALRYAAFRERFCPLDDGHATERVVERLRVVQTVGAARRST